MTDTSTEAPWLPTWADEGSQSCLFFVVLYLCHDHSIVLYCVCLFVLLLFDRILFHSVLFVFVAFLIGPSYRWAVTYCR